MNPFSSIFEKLNQPGEHEFFYQGHVGRIESILTVPSSINTNYIALLGHPHSLQGGTMNNKVVTTMARTFKELNIPSIRSNFRGVGASAGQFDQGRGESEDMLELARGCLENRPEVKFIFAGFSFGSYVAYRAAAQSPHALLITVAPPVHHFDYHQFQPPPSPWIIIQGDNDEIVPLSLILDFVADSVHEITLLRFDETGHFFHGKLTELKSRLISVVQEHLEMI